MAPSASVFESSESEGRLSFEKVDFAKDKTISLIALESGTHLLAVLIAINRILRSTEARCIRHPDTADGCPQHTGMCCHIQQKTHRSLPQRRSQRDNISQSRKANSGTVFKHQLGFFLELNRGLD